MINKSSYINFSDLGTIISKYIKDDMTITSNSFKLTTELEEYLENHSITVFPF